MSGTDQVKPDPISPILVLMPWLDRAMEGTVIGVLDLLKSINMLARLKWPSTPPPMYWQFADGFGKRMLFPPFEREEQICEQKIPSSRKLLTLPAFHVANSGQIGELVQRYPQLLEQVKRHFADGGFMLACGNGCVFPAAAGLLSGAQVTSSWIHRRWFEENFAGVDFSSAQPINELERLVLCVAREQQQAALLKSLEMMLDAGIVHACSSLLSYNPQRQDQAHELLSNKLIPKTSDTPAYKALKWLEHHLHLPVDMAEMAAAVSASERTVLRHFNDAYAMTPVEYLQKLRIDRAKVLLEITQQDMSSIAEACGYQDATSLRRVFKKSTGMTPGAYRMQFSLRAKNRSLFRTDPLASEATSDPR